jgi:hypothetical protein
VADSDLHAAGFAPRPVHGTGRKLMIVPISLSPARLWLDAQRGSCTI